MANDGDKFDDVPGIHVPDTNTSNLEYGVKSATVNGEERAVSSQGLVRSDDDFWTSEVMTHVYVLLFAGIMVIGQGADMVGTPPNTMLRTYYDYAVALGCISFILSLTIGVLAFYRINNQLVTLPITILLFVWNAIGVGITTFGDVFIRPNFAPNGYFGAWAGAVVSAILTMQLLLPESVSGKLSYRKSLQTMVRGRSQRMMYTIQFIASVVIMIVAAVECGERNFCTGTNAFGVSFGVINLVLVPIFYWLSRMGWSFFQWIVVVYGCWWIAAFLTLTFGAVPFESMGNGYFAITIGTFAAMNVISTTVGGHQNDDDSRSEERSQQDYPQI